LIKARGGKGRNLNRGEKKGGEGRDVNIGEKGRKEETLIKHYVCLKN